MFFKKIDLSDKRHVYAVGDIHGMFTMLETDLARVGFDPSMDHLLSVGDLVDRGPESHRAIEFATQPWMTFVRGNHEQLVKAALAGHDGLHISNGGKWFAGLSPDERAEHSRILNDAPVIIEATLKSGKRIGIVHADIPTGDWSDIEKLSLSEQYDWEEYCLWSRARVANPPLNGIKGIDHVYFGHTPKRSVFRMGNCSWIDTNACRGGMLTLVDCETGQTF